MNRTVNEYTGRLHPDCNWGAFIQALRKQLSALRRAGKLPDGADFDVADDDPSDFHLSTIAAVADIIRSRPEVARFRCRKIGETAKEK